MIGETISHCKIVEELGESSVLAVYRDDDEHLNRAIAIMVPFDLVSKDSERLGRFRREGTHFRAAAGIE